MNLPLLLDTCALVWIAGLAGDHHLGPVEEALDQARAEGSAAFVSPMTAWELGMLAAKGRLSFPMPIRAWVDQVVTTGQLRWAELSVDVLLAATALPGEVHGDPADRIIIATARENGFRLVTRDRKILDYAGKGHVMALEC